ncbi:MAG: hypothetical protein AB7I01_08480 [Gammaproteobacteria bacterium]
MTMKHHWAVILSAWLSAPVLAADVTPPPAAFTFGPYTVSVAADPDIGLTPRDFQITVSDQELVLTRLTAPFAGTLSKSFVADLDHDGAFEVVVTYSDPDSRATGIKVFSWRDGLLAPRPVAALDAGQSQGYRGGDEVMVADAHLVRLFQVYAEQDGEWTPTTAQRRLSYSFEKSRWLSE